MRAGQSWRPLSANFSRSWFRLSLHRAQLSLTGRARVFATNQSPPSGARVVYGRSIRARPFPPTPEWQALGYFVDGAQSFSGGQTKRPPEGGFPAALMKAKISPRERPRPPISLPSLESIYAVL